MSELQRGAKGNENTICMPGVGKFKINHQLPKTMTQIYKIARFICANNMVMVLMTMPHIVYSKQSTNMLESYLMKVEQYYSECMNKTEGITSEMLKCSATATDKIDKYIWPNKNRKIKQIEARKNFIKNNNLLCTKISSSYEGTNWSVVYSDCIYQQFVKKSKTKS